MDTEGAIIALARDKIDAKIAELEEGIRALRHERNRLSPISRFPPEVMTQIFFWIQQLYLGRFYSSKEDRYLWQYRQWTRVTHVSQHWRQVALSSKALWNIIPMFWIDYATESFNRLGSLPIFLFGASIGREDKRSALWETITTECHRIRFIRDWPGAALKNTMPLLEHLEASSGCESPFLFSPSLKTLSLSSCTFSWDRLTLPQLTTLEIMTPKEKIALDPFVSVLHNMPCLKHLKIGGIFPETTTFRLNDLQVAHPSPLLSSFRASGSVSLNLLGRLAFSAECSIKITDACARYPSLSPLVQALNRILPIRRMSLVCQTTDKETIDLELRDQPQNASTSIKLSISLGHGSDLNRWVKDLAMLSLDRLEHLSINLITGPVTWEESGLSHLPKLSHLDLGDTGRDFFEHIVKEYDGSKASKKQGDLSFKSLEVLTTRGFHLTRDLKKPLLVALAGREKAGYRFKKLVFSLGKITDDCEMQLQKYVDKVVVTVARKGKSHRPR
ncbi:hypothetical protein BDN72DRAFT_846861 [Pluteus cervinus]|uniref:Uncharacterized protein n=1 Tax=Pluteus cervinus TaxID=181527 RepID=A0ACD3AF35_9AGAR|nr:hypothetical protein BDN72DRAFT_846861 [Pluteus cervinus]